LSGRPRSDSGSGIRLNSGADRNGRGSRSRTTECHLAAPHQALGDEDPHGRTRSDRSVSDEGTDEWGLS
jgi:hypothetical protein